jgi:ABC-2 type transport system ATP-binding protein
MTQFDLPAERKIKHLSRGMRMKAALLSSLAYRPKLLVLDEPFSGLDPLARDDFVRGLLEARPGSATGPCWCPHTTSRRSSGWRTMWRCWRPAACNSANPPRRCSTASAHVEVTVPADSPPSIGTPPAGWVELEQAGGL